MPPRIESKRPLDELFRTWADGTGPNRAVVLVQWGVIDNETSGTVDGGVQAEAEEKVVQAGYHLPLELLRAHCAWELYTAVVLEQALVTRTKAGTVARTVAGSVFGTLAGTVAGTVERTVPGPVAALR